MSAEERHGIESALGELKTALAGDDKDAIEKKTELLAQSTRGARAARLRAGCGPQQAAPADAGAGAGAGDSGQANKDDVLDAEFEEVKGKERKTS